MPAEPALSRRPAFSALTARLPGSHRDRHATVTAPVAAAVAPGLPPASAMELDCYSQQYTANAEVSKPASVEELALVFREASARGRHVTLRAGGNAFDGQALGDQLVVSLEYLDEIHAPDTDALTITVGAGARWGDILDKVARLGLVPAVMVTTQKATAGGTLSGNCLSRFSPTFGKEGGWVERFELMTMAGRRIVCTPPADDEHPETWTPEERVFMAAIGGLGYVGAVYRITYRLKHACDRVARGPGLGVQTTLRKYTDYEHLAEHLVDRAQHMCVHGPAPEGVTLAEHPADQAIYSALIRRLNGRQSAVVLTSTYTTRPERKPLVIHKPQSTLRFVSELILRTRLDWILTLAVYHLLLSRRKTYVDDLRGFTFFMDGNSRVKAWGKRHGHRMPTVQQTFVVPFEPDDMGHVQRDPCKVLARWLDESNKVLRAHKVRPTFTDILFVHDTLHFGLSANAGKSGFAVSYAFETSNERRLRDIKTAFAVLADKLLEFDGRVYLVKNVYASPQTLATMYGGQAIAFLKVKREHDPGRLLENGFLKRTFGKLVDDVYAGVYD